MIFRRFLQRFRQQQWGAITTELAIVVIGVFIGLQVDNWNESRREAHRGHEPLSKVVVQVRQACAEGRADDARKLYHGMASIDDPSTSARWNVLQLLGREEEASRLLAYMDTPGYFNALSSFLVYPYFDLTRYPNLQKVLLAQGIHRPPPRRESYACKPEAASP